MPIYISEMSPKQHRGKLLSLLGLFFQIGLLVSVCLNIFYAKFCQGWRITFVPVGVLGPIYAIGIVLMPHSPRYVATASCDKYKVFLCWFILARWLVKRGREKEALAVLSQINGHNSKEEFVDTVLELKELRESTTVDSVRTFSIALKQVFQRKYMCVRACCACAWHMRTFFSIITSTWHAIILT